MAAALKHTSTRETNTQRSWDCTVAVSAVTAVVEPVNLVGEETPADPSVRNMGITAAPSPTSCRVGSTASTIPTTGRAIRAIAFVANLPTGLVRDTVNVRSNVCGGQGSHNKRNWRRRQQIPSSVATRVTRTRGQCGSIAGMWRLGGIYMATRWRASWPATLHAS